MFRSSQKSLCGQAEPGTEQQLRERNPHDSFWACPDDLQMVSRKPQIFVRTGLTGYGLPTLDFPVYSDPSWSLMTLEPPEIYVENPR